MTICSRPSQVALLTLLLVAGCGDVPDSISGDGGPRARPNCDAPPVHDWQCADGNAVSGDGCSWWCAVEDGWDCSEGPCVPICGDGLVVGDEPCDDGNRVAGDHCAPDCDAVIGSCGDGILQINEGCDGELSFVAEGIPWRCGDICQVELTDRSLSLAISLSDEEVGCVLRPDGRIRCWGDDAPEVPTDERFLAVDAGHESACAIREDGSPVCWSRFEQWLIDRYASAWVPSAPLARIVVHDDETYVTASAITVEGRVESFVFTHPDAIPPTPWRGHSRSFGGTRYRSLSEAMCAFAEDYTSICWSFRRNAAALVQPPGPLRDVIGRDCWIAGDGRVDATCPGWLESPADMGGRGGASPHAGCALRRDGTLVQLGSRERWRLPEPRDERFGVIACDSYAAGCGITFEGALVCWEGVDGRRHPLEPDFDPFAD